MFKKILVFILCLIFIGTFFITQKTPLFYRYGDTFELYLEKGGSLAHFVTVKKEEYAFYNNVTGESCVLLNNDLPVPKIFEDFNSKIIFVETLEEGVSYYGYSNDIKYVQYINGKKVNLHVFKGKTQTKIGSPIIYGSF